MRSATVVALMLLAIAPSAAAQGGRSSRSRVIVVSADLNETDLQVVAEQMVLSMTESPHFARLTTTPRVVVGKISNKNNLPIDIASLTDRIQVELVKTGRFELLDAQLRQAIALEYEYQQSGYVDPNKAKGPGAQTSADYIVTGAFSGERGHYRLSLSATELSSSVMRWADDKELREPLPPGTPTYKKIRTAGLITGGVMTGAGAILTYLSLVYSNTGYGYGTQFTPTTGVGVGLLIAGPVILLASFILPPLLFPPEAAPLAGLSVGFNGRGVTIGYSGSF